MRYSGSKIKFSDEFNSIINNFSEKNYYEPFIGGGAIFANLHQDTIFNSNSINEYHINDLNIHIMSIWNFIKHIDYSTLDKISKFIKLEFGDIKTNKESYYAYREYYNKSYHFTNDIMRGGYLYFLVNSCINSFARFGPNGFNQSYGNRLYQIDMEAYNVIQNRLQSTSLTNMSYDEIEYKENSIIFLDPPYFKRPSSYTSNFSNEDYIKFVDHIVKLTHNRKVIYTDIEDEYADKFFTKRFIRNIKNTAPSSSGELIGREVVYTNF